MDRAEIERLIAALNEFGDSHLIRAKDGATYGTWAFRTALTQLLAEVDHRDRMLSSAARSAGESSAERDGLAAAVREAGRQLDAMTRERDAARAESSRLQAMVDQLVTARDVARVEVERLRARELVVEGPLLELLNKALAWPRLTAEVAAMRPIVEAAEAVDGVASDYALKTRLADLRAALAALKALR